MLIFSKLNDMPSELAKAESWKKIVPELLQQSRPGVTYVLCYHSFNGRKLANRADLLSPGLCVITVSMEDNKYNLPSIGPQVLNVCSDKFQDVSPPLLTVALVRPLWLWALSQDKTRG